MLSCVKTVALLLDLLALKTLPVFSKLAMTRNVVVDRWQQDKNGKEAREETEGKSSGCTGEGER